MPEDPNDSRTDAGGVGPDGGTLDGAGAQATGGVRGGGATGPGNGIPGGSAESTLTPEEYATLQKRYADTKTGYDKSQQELKATRSELEAAQQAVTAFEEHHGISLQDHLAEQEAAQAQNAGNDWQYGAFGQQPGYQTPQAPQQQPAQPVVEDALARLNQAMQEGDYGRFGQLEAYYERMGVLSSARSAQAAPRQEIQPGMTPEQVQQIMDERLNAEYEAGVQFHRGIRSLEHKFGPGFLKETVKVDEIEMTREEALEEHCRKNRQSDPEAALLDFNREAYVNALVAQGVDAKLKELATRGQGEQPAGMGIFGPPAPSPPSPEMAARLPQVGLSSEPPTE